MQHAKRTTTRTHTRLLAACLLGLAPGTAAATPVIAELFYDAVGSDDGSTFVEIYGEPGTVLDGLTVEGVNGAGGGIGPIVSLFGVIAEDGVFVLADRLSDGSSFVSDFDQLANFDFQNGPDSVQLVDGEVVIDALGYGSFDPGDVFAGEGAPAPDVPAGSSLARVFADVDTGDNALDFAALDLPTPGAVALLPEPGSGTLLAFAVAALALLHRGRPTKSLTVD